MNRSTTKHQTSRARTLAGALTFAVATSILATALPAAAARSVQHEQTEAAATTNQLKLMVVGDSISATSRYGVQASGRVTKAWWSHLADTIKPRGPVIVSAQAGSGMLNRGNSAPPADLAGLDKPSARCNGTTFGGRLAEVRRARPDVIIVAGGRNDFKKCGKKGTVQSATAAETRNAVRDYMGLLATDIRSLGLRPTDVYVMTPWGNAYGPHRDNVTYWTEYYAKSRGFQWIQTPALIRAHTSDGTHPNAAGTRKLADHVLNGSNIAARFGVARPNPGPVQVRCASVSKCVKAESFVRAEFGRPGRNRYWGQTTGSATNYVAYRLTHHGKKAARLAGNTPATWRNAARKSRATIAATPTVGAVAWWPADPNNTNDKNGHVGIVQRVSADGSSVVVSEYRRQTGFRVVTYTGAAFPRTFWAFGK